MQVQSPPPFTERRRHPRFLATLPIEYGRGEARPKSPACASNIGEGGCLAVLREQLRVGEKIRIKVFFAVGSILTVIGCMGRVIWFRPDPVLGKEGYFSHGLEFEGLSAEDAKKLRCFLNQFGDPA